VNRHYYGIDETMEEVRELLLAYEDITSVVIDEDTRTQEIVIDATLSNGQDVSVHRIRATYTLFDRVVGLPAKTLTEDAYAAILWQHAEMEAEHYPESDTSEQG
jgi:hypothetical protein